MIMKSCIVNFRSISFLTFSNVTLNNRVLFPSAVGENDYALVLIGITVLVYYCATAGGYVCLNFMVFYLDSFTFCYGPILTVLVFIPFAQSSGHEWRCQADK